MRQRWTAVGAVACALALGACDNNPATDAGTDSGTGQDAGRVDGGGGGPPDAGGGTDAGDSGTAPSAVLPRASHSSTIDISPDDSLVAMVNRGDGSLSVFTTSDNSRISRTPTGAQPSSVVIHPNGTIAYVANQADGTVVEVTGIGGASASAGRSVDVGSEPTGLALSPTGAQLFVAEHGEGRVSVIDTATMTVSQSFDVRSPYALAVTNDGDTDDSDESLIVPEFFGRPNSHGEANNQGRTGFVHVRPLDDLATATTPIELDPIDSTFPAGGGTTDMASPNQLSSVTVVGDRAYITSISVSPEGPVAFNRNVHPVFYVVDLTAGAEDTSATGSANLAALVRDQITDPAARNFLGDIWGSAFIGQVAYVVSRAGDTVQRLDYSGSTIAIGSAMNKQIDVGAAPAGASTGCQTPTGIVTTNLTTNRRAFLNCWASRNLGVVSLADQALTTVVESTAPPSSAEDISRNRGLRFFFTGRGRWSNQSWSACSSCHPGGYTDNVTWAFAAGPRQTTSLDGTFSHGSGAQKQRVLNWTGIFDEIHDFERNTRGVSGGFGAITNGDCSSLATETQQNIGGIGGLAQPLKELEDAAGSCTTNWDDVEAWIRTIRPPSGRRSLDSASVERGRALFMDGNCARCHGGAGWTVSRRFWTPSSANNTSLTTTAFTAPTVAGWVPAWNAHTFQIQPEQPGGVAPPEVACVIRNIDTFGVRGAGGTLDATATAALEVRDNGAGAQGAGGYNVPSLYGLQVGAPYLHHGQAETLEDLLDPNGPWTAHLRAGNAVFLVGDTGSDRADLVAFLMSIDATTAEIAVPSGFDACPATFP